MANDSTTSWREQVSLAAYVAVIVSLALLAITPAVMLQRLTSVVQDNDQIYEPASLLERELTFQYERKIAELRALLVSSDRRYFDSYRDARAAEAVILGRLEPLVQQISPVAVQRLALVRRVAAEWHVWDDSLAAEAIALDDYEATRLARQRILEDSTFASTARLRAEIDLQSDAAIEVSAAEFRRQRLLALGLGAIALLAALAVGWFAWRQRSLTGQLQWALSEESRLRAAERTAREQVTMILESITDAFFAVDRAWVITYVNSEAERLLHRRREQLVGRHLWDEFAPAVGTPFQGEYERAMAEQQAVEFEEYYAPLAIWVDVRAFPTAQGLSVFFRDITRRKQLQEERERLLVSEREARAEAVRRRDELERVTESRTRLMRGFSHDLKNPLGAADGYAQLLEEGIMGDISPKQKESVGRIRISIQTALRLIHDLLELARAEAGQIELVPTLADAAELARGSAEDFRAQAAAAGLELEVRASGPVEVRTDVTRVRQILSNLLSNAVKYTPSGRITVETEARSKQDDQADHPWVSIAVSDSGPGIPAEKREAIFQEFTRLDPDAPHGAGVGLAISRRIARLLGGDIVVDSDLGRGSTFTLWLPAGVAE